MKKPRRNSNSLRDYFFSHFGMTKRQRSGFFVLIFLIVGIEAIIQFYPFEQDHPTEAIKFTPTEEALLLKETPEENQFFQQVETEGNLKTFNPNALDEQGFIDIGFSQKQANSLIRYRYSLGGNFKNLDEFASSYVVSDRMLEKLKPYIEIEPFPANLIENHYNAQPNNKGFYQSNNSSPRTTLKAFDPNILSQKEWEELGFSEHQAASILNFKNSLKDKRFENLDQIKACYVINDYMFNRIKDYVRISPAKNKSMETQNLVTEALNPNKMTVSDWQNLGWDEQTANNIIKYKEFIGGFNSLEDLINCQYITEESLEKIKNRLEFKE